MVLNKLKIFGIAALVCSLTIAAAALPGNNALAQPVVVNNSSTPAQGVIKTEMNELWRSGGDDDEMFFGTIGSIQMGPTGNIHALDSQLSQVHIFSPDGELLRTVCNQGDGPGEVRAAGGLFVGEDESVYVLQGFPGKVVKLNPDGTPAKTFTYTVGEGTPGQFGVMVWGHADGNGVALAGIQMGFQADGTSNQTYHLSRCDDDGKQIVRLLDKQYQMNFNDYVMSEIGMDFIWTRTAVGPDRKVYAVPERNEYAISVYSLDGKIEKIIKRDYTSPNRTEEQRKLANQVMRAISANYPTPPNSVEIEDTEADVTTLGVTKDGRIWVQTSRGGLETPAGCWIILDVFTADGQFEKQVALKGDFDPDRDGLTILPDGRVVVVVGALDAFLAQQGASTGTEDETREVPPVEIICYQLDLD